MSPLDKGVCVCIGVCLSRLCVAATHLSREGRPVELSLPGPPGDEERIFIQKCAFIIDPFSYFLYLCTKRVCQARLYLYPCEESALSTPFTFLPSAWECTSRSAVLRRQCQQHSWVTDSLNSTRFDLFTI